MANNYQSFDEWYAQLLKLAKKHHWNVENPDEWRTYYNQGMTPEDAFQQEVS